MAAGDFLSDFAGADDESQRRKQQQNGQTAMGASVSNPWNTGGSGNDYNTQGGDANDFASMGWNGESPEAPESNNLSDWNSAVGPGVANTSFAPTGIKPDQPTPTLQTTNNSSWDTDGYATPSFTASNFGNAPSGWDQTKWTDPNHQTPKYVVGRILASNGDLRDANARNTAIEQIKQAYPGAQFNGKDKISIDGGRSWVDIFGGASAGIYSPAWQSEEQGGSNPATQTNMTMLAPGASPGAQPTSSPSAPAGGSDVDPFAAMGGGVRLPGGEWVPKDHPLASQGTPAGGGNPGNGGVPGAPLRPTIDQDPSDNPELGSPEDVAEALKNPKNALMQQLMERMRQSRDIDGNDPIIKNQTDRYRANEERARRDYLSDVAEGSSRFSTGAMRGQQRMTAERMGQRVGGFEANLVAQELSTRRGEIENALNSMGNMLTEQERQTLEREKMALDASLRRQQMDMQNSQFYSQLSQADRHFLDQLAQQGRFAEMDDAFRKMQLGQNDSQWRDEMGFKTQKERNEWDWKQRGNQ